MQQGTQARRAFARRQFRGKHCVKLAVQGLIWHLLTFYDETSESLPQGGERVCSLASLLGGQGRSGGAAALERFRFPETGAVFPPERWFTGPLHQEGGEEALQMKGRVRSVLMVLLLGIFLFSAFQIWRKTEDYRRGGSLYARLSRYAEVPEQAASSSEDGLPWPEVDFEALREVNSDIVAWLFSEGTPIHYPVARGEDNEFYLHHLFDRSEGRCGTIFLEAQNAPDFSDPHSILYGHHMKDGSMFKSLKGYQEQSYYEEHPVLLLVTPEKRWRAEVFAGYVADTGSDAWKLDFSNPTERKRWIEEQQEKSTFRSEVVPGDRERILTLSTCSYEFSNARFVVHAVLRE